MEAKGSEWRNGKPTDGQSDLFQRLIDRVKDISAGSISFAEPGGKRGEYGAAIAALNSEIVLCRERKIESEEARQFIKQTLRSEERRVGKECKYQWATEHKTKYKKKIHKVKE